MSTSRETGPAGSGPAAPQTSKEEKRKSMGSKMLTRVKTMLKRDKRPSGTAKPAAAASSTAPAAATTSTAETSKPAPPTEKKQADLYPNATKVSRAKLHEERVRQLGEKFGLEITANDLQTPEGETLRVEKPIRMRVRHICDQCQTTFGATKECPKCKHSRCKKCERMPSKRTEAEKVASRERRAAILKERKENPILLPDWDHSRKRIPLTKPGRPGCPDLVYKRPRQRVRRNCCQCAVLIPSGTKKCSGCAHIRCTDCPRDPAMKKYYPYGYPGDEWGAKSIPHHKCHECEAKFAGGADNGTECGNCQHKKCDDCPRITPQKVDPEPDPDVLKSLEAKLTQMKLK